MHLLNVINYLYCNSLQMAPLISETCSSPTAQSSSTIPNPHNKWSCSICTYLNWPRATKCTQCLSKRKQNSSPTEPTNYTLHDQSNNASVDSGTDNVLSDNYYNDRNKSWSRTIKWTCASCTYENWPKSVKVSYTNAYLFIYHSCYQ